MAGLPVSQLLRLMGPEMTVANSKGVVDCLQGVGEAVGRRGDVVGHAHQALPLCGGLVGQQAGQCGDGEGGFDHGGGGAG